MRNRIGMILILMAGATYGLGCSQSLFDQHARDMDVMRGLIVEASQRLGETGVGQVQGQLAVIDPGIRTGGGVEYYGYARYQGLSGTAMGSMQGDLSRPVDEEAKQAILRIYQSTDLNDREKSQLIQSIIMKWMENRPPEEPAEPEPEGPIE